MAISQITPYWGLAPAKQRMARSTTLTEGLPLSPEASASSTWDRQCVFSEHQGPSRW